MKMEGLNKWIVIVATLIIGIVLGGILHEAFDMFSVFGLPSQLKRMEREYGDLTERAKGRDQLLTERHRLDRERVERDRAGLENALEAERGRAERAEDFIQRQNILLESTIEATGRGKERVAEGIRSIERLKGIAGRLEEQARRDSTGISIDNPRLAPDGDR